MTRGPCQTEEVGFDLEVTPGRATLTKGGGRAVGDDRLHTGGDVARRGCDNAQRAFNNAQRGFGGAHNLMWCLAVLAIVFATVLGGGSTATAGIPVPALQPVDTAHASGQTQTQTQTETQTEPRPDRSAPATTSSTASTPSVPPVDDVLIPARGGVRASTNAVGSNPTRGPGVYDVVVVGVTTEDGPSPATAENSPPIVSGADSYWNETTGGRYRLDFRSFVGVSTPTALCTLPAADLLVDSAVTSATDGLIPRPGRAGILVVSVMPQPSACAFPGGMGWLGIGSQLIGGLAWSQQQSAALVLAHESGHNFGLMHANNLECGDGVWPFPLPQFPSWPCERTEYGDITSVMGNGTAAAGKLNAAHLKILGLLSAEQSVDLGTNSGDVDLVPLYGAEAGLRAATIAVGGVTPATMMVEYRPDLGGSGVTLRQVGFAETWLYGISWRGFSAVSSRKGMTAGTTVDLGDGTVVSVVSTGSAARVHVERPGAVVPARKWGSLTATNIVDGVPGTIAPTDPLCVRELTTGITVTCLKSGASKRTVTRLPTGNYRLEDTSEPFQVGVDHAGATVAVTAGGSAQLALSSHRLQGTITGEGAPLGGVTVEVFGEPGTTIGQSSGPTDPLLSATTDSAGHFQIPGQFYSGETMKVRVRPPQPWVRQWVGGPDRATARIVTIAAETSNRVDVDLARAGSIAGRTSYGGHPPRSANVFAIDTTGYGSSVVAAADGTFRFDGLRPENYRVEVNGLAPDGTRFSARYVSPTGGTTVAVGSGAAVTVDLPFVFPAPSAPTGVVATAGEGSASVAFVAPTATGGAQLSNFEVSTDNGATWVSRTPASIASPVLVGGLTNGTTYQVRLRAVNFSGPGAASVAVSVTPRPPTYAPTPPRDVSGVPGRLGVVVSWSPPISDGGAPVTGYTVTGSPGDSTCTTSTALSCEMTAVVYGLGYTFTVTATNAVGTSGPSLPTPVVVPRIFPWVPTFGGAGFLAPRQATLTWVAPAFDGGAALTGYRVALSTPNSSTVFGDGVATNATAHTWVGLVPGARYVARVAAVNAAGESDPLFVPFRQATVASTVRAARVAAWPRPGAATIVWAAPASQGGTPVQRYLVRLSAPNSTKRFGAWTANQGLSRLLAGLRKGATYRMQILAVNSQGNSAAATLTFRQAR